MADGIAGAGVAGPQHHRGGPLREVEGEGAGRRDILDIVEPAFALDRIEHVAQPERVVGIGAVGQRGRGRHAVIGAPGHGAARHGGVEAERAIGLVQSAVVAAGQQRPHGEPARAGRSVRAPPGQSGFAAVGLDEDLLHDLGAVRQGEDPGGPGLPMEARDALAPSGWSDIGEVALGGQGIPVARRLDPGLDPVDQDEAVGGRRGGGEQQARDSAASAPHRRPPTHSRRAHRLRAIRRRPAPVARRERTHPKPSSLARAHVVPGRRLRRRIVPTPPVVPLRDDGSATSNLLRHCERSEATQHRPPARADPRPPWLLRSAPDDTEGAQRSRQGRRNST